MPAAEELDRGHGAGPAAAQAPATPRALARTCEAAIEAARAPNGGYYATTVTALPTH